MKNWSYHTQNESFCQSQHPITIFSKILFFSKTQAHHFQAVHPKFNSNRWNLWGDGCVLIKLASQRFKFNKKKRLIGKCQLTHFSFKKKQNLTLTLKTYSHVFSIVTNMSSWKIAMTQTQSGALVASWDVI